MQLLRLVPRHSRRCFLPGCRRDVPALRRVPLAADDEGPRKRRVMPRDGDLVVQVIGVGPSQVHVRHTENRGMVGADPGARERRLGEFLDDRLPAVGEPDVDERVTIPVQPHARRRREELLAEAGDRGGDLARDREDGEAVPGEERREIARLAAD